PFDDQSDVNLKAYISSGGVTYLETTGNTLSIRVKAAEVGYYSQWGFGYYDGKTLYIGNLGATKGGFVLSTQQTPDAPIMFVNDEATGSRSWIIADRSDITFDFAHAQQDNPTLFIHSAAQSTTQWLGLTHNSGSHTTDLKLRSGSLRKQTCF
ncbi:unnamed protein product, partial [marine sediment metagenome]